MKITALLLFVLIFCLHAENTNSQNIRVTIKQQNTELENILNDIEKQTDYFFVYNKYVNVNRKVSLNLNKRPLEEVLDQLFKGTDVKYTVDGAYILLSPRQNPNNTTLPIVQQGKKITGIIKDTNGEPVIGANIIELGTTNGVITDMDGTFYMNVPEGAILRISYIGYLSKDIKVEKENILNIILLEDNQTLDEVVVVGYGTQKKSTLTGSVAAVKSEQLTVAPVGNVTNMLTGKLPGLITKQSSGQPGADAASLSIRGFGAPLLIVDGAECNLNNLDANQIESITILKDGAASIYGARAGNGVVLVTTKRGINQKPTITFNASYTMQGVMNRAKTPSSGQLAQMMRESHLNSGQPEETAPFSEEAIEKYFAGNDPAYPSTDWYKEAFRDWAPQHNENVSVRGGSEKIKYYALLGYQKQETMIKKNGGDYSRYNLQSSVDADITDRLTLSVDLKAIFDNNKLPGRGMGNSDGAIWMDLYDTKPWYPAHFPDPTKNAFGGANVGSILLSSNMDTWGYYSNKNRHLHTTGNLVYDLPFIKGLKAKAMVNYQDLQSYTKVFQKPYDFYTYNYAANEYTLAGQMWGKAQLTESVGFYRQFTQQYSLNYDYIFDYDHHITALALYESVDMSGNNFEAFRRDFLTSSIEQLFVGSDLGKSNNGSASEMGRMSVVGRVNYSYQDKYLLEAILRADASAKFPKGSQWGYFPSVSVGWMISKENFMANLSNLDLLKLRASYGSSGYDNVGDFQYMTGYNVGNKYQWGDDIVSGLIPKGLANPFMTWEKMFIYNGGVDFSVWNRSLYGSVEGFYRYRKGILATRAQSLPSTFGATLPPENINSSNDRGFEISLGTSHTANDFQYDLVFNLSWARSKWDHFEEAEYTDPDQSRLNKQSGQWSDRVFGYISDGLFTSQEEINALTYQYDGLGGNQTLRPGDIKYKDINNDGVLDWKDQQEIGKGDNPHWFYGFTGSFRYKDFDLAALFQGAAGFSSSVSNVYQTKKVYELRWTEDNNDRNAKQPRMGGVSSNSWSSDYWIRSVSYLRLKNLAIGYTIPKDLSEKINVETLRLYISGTNLITLSNLKDYNIDPELPSGSAARYYPQQRTISFGINLSF